MEQEPSIRTVEVEGLSRVVNIEAVKNNRLDEINTDMELVKLRKFAGKIYADILESEVVLFSRKLVMLLLENEVLAEDIFYKTLVLQDADNTRQEIYNLAVVKKIDCLNEDESEIEDGNVISIVIDEEKVDDKLIFRIEGTDEKLIIVEEELKEKIERKLAGVRFVELDDYNGRTHLMEKERLKMNAKKPKISSEQRARLAR